MQIEIFAGRLLGRLLKMYFLSLKAVLNSTVIVWNWCLPTFVHILKLRAKGGVQLTSQLFTDAEGLNWWVGGGGVLQTNTAVILIGQCCGTKNLREFLGRFPVEVMFELWPKRYAGVIWALTGGSGVRRWGDSTCRDAPMLPLKDFQYIFSASFQICFPLNFHLFIRNINKATFSTRLKMLGVVDFFFLLGITMLIF